MEQSFLKSILVKIAFAILVLALIDLGFLNWWVLTQSKESKVASTAADLRDVSGEVEQQNEGQTSPTPTPNGASKSAATPTPTTIIKEQTTVQQNTVVQTAQKEFFIPIGDGSTQSDSYVNLPGVQVTINSANYTGILSVDFEANIWVTNGNGIMYAQLYNLTDGHPVWNSEISTNSGSGVLTVSAPITLDSGQKTYVVQAKTGLTNFPANVSTARVHILLK